MENGDISSFPKEMFRAFDSKQILVTPSLLNSIIGSEKSILRIMTYIRWVRKRMIVKNITGLNSG